MNNIKVDAENYCSKTLAEQQSNVADMNAKVTNIDGEVESKLAKVLENRRQYEYLNAKLEVIESISKNKNAKIFGDQKESAMAQMAAFNLFSKGGGLP